MAALQSVSSIEYEALRKNFLGLVRAVSQGHIPLTLFQEGIVNESILGLPKTMTSMEIGENIMKQVLLSIQLKSELFEPFCKALEAEPNTEAVLAALRSEYMYFTDCRRLQLHGFNPL